MAKRNYCHVCHTRFVVFFPFPSCCVIHYYVADDGDGSDNVFIKLCRTRLKCYVLVNFPRVEFLGPHPSLEKERNTPVCVCLFVLYKTPHKEILRPRCQARQGNVPKKSTACAKLLFCLSKLMLFLRSRCHRRHRC